MHKLANSDNHAAMHTMFLVKCLHEPIFWRQLNMLIGNYEGDYNSLQKKIQTMNKECKNKKERITLNVM